MKFVVLSGEEAQQVPRPPLKTGRIVISESAQLFAEINQLYGTLMTAKLIQQMYRQLPARDKRDLKAERLKRNALTLATKRNQG